MDELVQRELEGKTSLVSGGGRGIGKLAKQADTIQKQDLLVLRLQKDCAWA